MSTKDANWIDEFDATTPEGTELYSTTDDYLRGIARSLLNQFPSLLQVAVTASAAELNKMDGFTGSTLGLNEFTDSTVTTEELDWLNGVTSQVEYTAQKNIANGYGGLDAGAQLLSAQIPDSASVIGVWEFGKQFETPDVTPRTVTKKNFGKTTLYEGLALRSYSDDISYPTVALPIADILFTTDTPFGDANVARFSPYTWNDWVGDVGISPPTVANFAITSADTPGAKLHTWMIFKDGVSQGDTRVQIPGAQLWVANDVRLGHVYGDFTRTDISHDLPALVWDGKPYGPTHYSMGVRKNSGAAALNFQFADNNVGFGAIIWEYERSAAQFIINPDTILSADLQVDVNLNVDGITTLDGTTINGTLDVVGATTVVGTTGFTGKHTQTGDMDVLGLLKSRDGDAALKDVGYRNPTTIAANGHTFDDEDVNRVLIATGTSDITVPSSVSDGWWVQIMNIQGSSITLQSGATYQFVPLLSGATPLVQNTVILEAGSVCTLYRRDSSTNIYVTGSGIS